MHMVAAWLVLVLGQVTERDLSPQVWLLEWHFCLLTILALLNQRNGRNGYVSSTASGMFLTWMKRRNNSRLASLFIEWGKKQRIFGDPSSSPSVCTLFGFRWLWCLVTQLHLLTGDGLSDSLSELEY